MSGEKQRELEEQVRNAIKIDYESDEEDSVTGIDGPEEGEGAELLARGFAELVCYIKCC